MILRRLTQSLKEQNWTAIVVEFVLLVCGVFLGIQAANWNEQRREHALEAEYIARLQRDFSAIDARLSINLTPVSYTHLDVYKRQARPYAPEELIQRVRAIGAALA